MAPSTRRPEVDRSSPMAFAADPLASFSALSSSSPRASLSHQNSHARESRDRPLAERFRGGNIETIDPASGATGRAWLEGILLAADVSAPCCGRGGEGEVESFVTTVALPSLFIDSRIKDEVRLALRSGPARRILGKKGCAWDEYTAASVPLLLRFGITGAPACLVASIASTDVLEESETFRVAPPLVNGY